MTKYPTSADIVKAPSLSHALHLAHNTKVAFMKLSTMDERLYGGKGNRYALMSALTQLLLVNIGLKHPLRAEVRTLEIAILMAKQGRVKTARRYLAKHKL